MAGGRAMRGPRLSQPYYAAIFRPLRCRTMKPRFALPALALIAALVCGAMAQDAEPDADTAPRANAARKPHAPLVINDDTIGVLRQHQVGSIILPDGKPPFAAVIVLHGCNGVSPNTRVWARRIASWGYAALIVD